jgi:purine-nucleoside phosphorylase
MTYFEALFGIKAEEIQKNCILLPLLTPGILKKFKIKKLYRGKLFGAASARKLSVVVSGVGPALAGDAVLYLKESPCQNIILFGSCGLVKEKANFSIGSLVAPAKSYFYESFSQLLLEKNKKPKAFLADEKLFRRLSEFGQNRGLRKVVCATVSSLKLEEKMQDVFIRTNIDVVDMECSAFFSACGFSGKKAASIFYISDIIKKKPFYSNLDSTCKLKLASAIEKATDLLCAFIK